MTPKQRIFALEYLVDRNAKQAAIRAGYSAKTAEQLGYQLLQVPSVRELVDAATAEKAAELGVTRERVIQELATIGFSSMSDVADWGEREVAIGYDADGKRLSAAEIGDAAVVHRERAPYLNLRDRDELTPEARAAVSEVSLTKDGFKIKLHDKVTALEKLGRHLGMFAQDINIMGPVKFVIEGAPK